MERLGPYLLGPNDENRGIYTGDARELAEGIPNESVDLIFTDPVYDQIDDYRWLAETAQRILKPDCACLISAGIGFLDTTLEALSSLAYRWTFVWYQSNNMQRADPGYCKWSPILWFEKGRSKTVYAIQDLRNVPVTIGRARQDNGHHWAKRTELVSYYIEGFSNRDSLIFDPFVGGGTVSAVCKMLGHRWLAFEIDPDTAEKARQRVAKTQPPLEGWVDAVSQMEMAI